jgi:hypothetical protein
MKNIEKRGTVVYDGVHYTDRLGSLYLENTGKRSTGHGGGADPYLYPVVGPPTKLPNIEEIDRLYQDDSVVVNARVSRASPAIQQEIQTAVASLTDIAQVISDTAHFFSHVFSGSRHDQTDHVTVDLEQKSTTLGTRLFDVGSPTVDTEVCPYVTVSRSRVIIPISWGRTMCLRITFCRHPPIRNGLSVSGTGLEKASGLLIRNYRPKFFRLNALDSLGLVEFPRHCKRVLTARGIVDGYTMQIAGKL